MQEPGVRFVRELVLKGRVDSTKHEVVAGLSLQTALPHPVLLCPALPYRALLFSALPCPALYGLAPRDKNVLGAFNVRNTVKF